MGLNTLKLHIDLALGTEWNVLNSLEQYLALTLFASRLENRAELHERESHMGHSAG